jgi:hypothetical protein
MVTVREPRGKLVNPSTAIVKLLQLQAVIPTTHAWEVDAIAIKVNRSSQNCF